MDILLLNWMDIRNPAMGGAEIILYELAKRLVAEGHTVTWFCRKFPGCTEREIIDGINVIRRGNRLTVYFEAYWYYKMLTHKPDRVIESINTIAWQTPFYVPASRRIAYINQLAKEVLYYQLPWGISFAAYMLERLEYIPYKNTRFLCYSGSVKEDISQFGVPLDHISVFPMGLDQKRYVPGDKAKQPLFIFVARLVKMKRPDLCIAAMKLVVKKYPEAQLAIIGYGPEESALARQIKEEHLEDSVFIVNKNNVFFAKNAKDQKVKFMQKAWALLLPSVKEGWGMVVTEAAACQTPSIVTNVTGLKDSVVDGKTGIILSSHPTAEELAQTMIHFIESKRYRNGLSKQAVIWSKQFSWEKCFKRFRTLVS